MDEAYSGFIKQEQELRREEQASGLVTIDTLRSKPRIRHLAVEQDRGWMKTMCGHRVIRYFRAGLCSEFFADGTRYARRCPICFAHEIDAGGVDG